MIDYLWQSTLFALVIAAMAPIFRKQGTATLFWLWFAASVKFLVLLSLADAAWRLPAGADLAPADVLPTTGF